MDVNHWQFSLGVGFEELFVPVIQAIERAKEVDGDCREIHDEVIDCLGNSEDLRSRSRFRWRRVPRAFGSDCDDVLFGGSEFE